MSVCEADVMPDFFWRCVIVLFGKTVYLCKRFVATVVAEG